MMGRAWGRRSAWTRPAAAALVLSLATAAGCTSETPTPSASGPPATSSEAPSASGLIPQPSPPEDVEVADEADRVDLAMPTFSDPITITNPLFPISDQASVLLLGTVEDLPFRTEVTLLPFTRTITWERQPVEVLISQYVAFLDGQLEEVAYDYYAQADDGSVWYFGEDVFNFADGAIADTHGTWIAGIDGPAAMIMPANPQAGDVYRPENIPGLVFEEVTVQSTDETLDGPLGPIEGGVIVREVHMDGATEDKTFAPGYGEFFTDADGDVEALAMAVPTDAADEALPDDLATMTAAALDAIDAAHGEDWEAGAAAAEAVSTSWEAYREAADVPRLVEPLLDEAVVALGDGMEQQDAEAAQAAIDTARLAFDLQLRYRPVPEVDLARFDLWLAQLVTDAAAEDVELANGDYFALDYVRERLGQTISADDEAELNLGLEELIGAIGDEDFEAVTEIASGLREVVASIGS